MTKMINLLKRTTYYGERLFTVCGALSLIVIIISITIGVVERYVFNSPLTWPEEMSVLMLVVLAFFSIGAATVKRKHVVADFLIQNANEKYKRIISVIANMMSVFFVVILFYSALKIIPTLTFKTSSLKIPRQAYYWPIFAIVPIMILTYVQEILELIAEAKYKKKGKTASVQG
ncbi:TRAP transporter small permease [Petroclostridium sp. X23]|uniref:TRAP transporter small permease n=1 Tax=Petroclostridium sp. X23 TaxID=3045146 RepID=UPI0024AD8A93|nr:TRAP transporter small permease [Petroclostridium sp. X23]WHH60623.1 TRAP transporter small permease [Petroclostridium sp. X23]